MAINNIHKALGDVIADVDEETFLLFSQTIRSQNLGFVDNKATSLEFSIQGKDLTILQSPGLLYSDRKKGTTGAVVWRITPAFAGWIASKDIHFINAILSPSATVLELGCGVSGIIPLLLAPKIGRYLVTDQEYVFKLLKENLLSNTPGPKPSQSHRHGMEARNESQSNIEILALDWESDSASSVSSYLPPSSSIDLLIACDCIYNEGLIEPFVNTCTEICRLRQSSDESGQPTVCVIAQQLRSDSVFEAWLSSFFKRFRVWRVPDGILTEDLKSLQGFVVHVGVLRDHD